MNPDTGQSELIVWLTTEARAIARLLTPRALIVGAAALLGAWLVVRFVEWCVDMLWRLGGDSARRFHWLVPAARIGVSVGILYLLLVGSFRAAPVLTVVVTLVTALVVLFAFSGQLQSAYVGMGMMWRGRIKPGDRFELAGHVGIVRRFGLLRLELRDATGATVHVPNRMLEDGVVRVESVKNTSNVHLRLRVDDPSKLSATKIRRTAMLSPYRVAGSAITVNLTESHAEVGISVWSDDAKPPALAHLETALKQLAPTRKHPPD